jgi:hypothetical protein
VQYVREQMSERIQRAALHSALRSPSHGRPGQLIIDTSNANTNNSHKSTPTGVPRVMLLSVESRLAVTLARLTPCVSCQPSQLASRNPFLPLCLGICRLPWAFHPVALGLGDMIRSHAPSRRRDTDGQALQGD